jgi:hypothetical protein
MPERSRAQESSRAEARRRARQAARGEDLEEPAFEDEVPPQPRSSLLSRLVPAAPPLAGKGDPLEGFDDEGRQRRVAAALYLLRSNPLAWAIPAILWALLTQLPQNDSTTALITSVGQYVVLIAAGWVGWQRPWLFGLVAGAVAVLLAVGLSLALLSVGVIHQAPGSSDAVRVVNFVALEMLLYAGIGALAGWYGGYLRRRLADQRPSQQPGSRSRRR